MSGISGAAKFTTTTQGHIHPETPKVFVGHALPTTGMKRGDIWIYAAPSVQMDDGEEQSP